MLAAALLAGSHASAAPATWTPVAGQVRGAVMDAAADGPRVLVVSVDRRQVIVTTIRDRRVVRRQVVLDSFRRGTVDRASASARRCAHRGRHASDPRPTSSAIRA